MFEKAWLLLVDYHMRSKNNDAKCEKARDMLYFLIDKNHSCLRAHEYLGYIFEVRDNNYFKSCSLYEISWKLTSKKNPMIGFKYGYNLLKANRFSEAIDVGREILEKCPNYPRVNEDIIERGRMYWLKARFNSNISDRR